ncbi:MULTISPECIES: methyltransferase domain-containing protein [unclassified Nitratiruptor]|uniref:methyltransferase domain-containing protein n=1 Tax=unclassified Nitratiruptor TaxID=2624044 RepID=UPI001914E9C0|nr:MULTISPECIES: methyltransferase domain-containing protein [unclassified Nitratiruptor]
MKQKLYKIYGFLHTLKYPDILKASIKSLFDETVFDNATHLKIAADWLLFMQNEDSGYSRKFSFLSGRDKSYIETTGYIIPSMWRVGEYVKEDSYIKSAKKAGEWLLKVQNEDGSFSEIDYNKPFAFDTGQCLIGLNFLYEKTKDSQYFEAAKKAAYWLANNQEADGRWERVAYNKQPHTYYSRVAAAMYMYGNLANDEEIKKAALKNIEWVLSRQDKNGFFQLSSFLEGVPPFLHTLIYVLEGLLDIYAINRDKKILEAVLKNANRFKEINLHRDLILCSQYDSNFTCVNKERCVTGLAQWAGVAMRLFKITNDEDYKKCAINTLFYLKAKQLKSSIMQGGFSASIPFWGKYGGFDFVNWTNKFFIDALLEYENLSREIEQENFVKTAFNISSDVVTNNLSYMDKEYIKRLKNILPKDKKVKVLDVGCGKGVIINELRKGFKNIEFFGIDPIFEEKYILKGSVYNIPFKENFFDMVMAFEVLQHTYIDSALKEIKRVLKNNGEIIIGERNPYSILGILKPILEFKGKWMYSFDSPFREKWYSKNEWEKILKENGFKVENIEVIEGNGKRFVNRYYCIRGIVL